MQEQIQRLKERYSVIIWDWYYTLYDPRDSVLYDFVGDLFVGLSDLDHFLVTTSSDPEKRIVLVKRFSISKHFKEIIPTGGPKGDVFRDIIDRYGYSIADVLVVGDNTSNELGYAKELGIDNVHIEELVSSDRWSK